MLNHDDLLETFLVGLLCLVLIVGGVCFHGVAKRQHKITKCSQLTILEVGGCNNTGQCGVQYDNGRFGNAYLPVIGQKNNKCFLNSEDK